MLSASPDRGRAHAPALLLALMGLLLLALGLIWSSGATTAPRARADAAVAPPPAAASTAPGALTRPEDLEPRPERWQPAGVLPPDSPFRAGVAPTSAVVRGRVVLPRWAAWPRRATVILARQEDGREFGRAIATEQEPEYRFSEVPFGDYRLRLEADEFEPLALLLTASVASPDHYQTLLLTPAASVAGRVLDAGGAPVADIGVCVELRPQSPTDLVLPLEGRTAADGSFRIPGLAAGEYDVYPGAARAPVGARHSVFVGPGAPQAWADLQVSGLGAAQVRLEDLERAGLAGVKVVAQMTRPAGEIPSYVETRAPGEDGVARFPWLPPGEYGFTAYGGAFRRIVRESTVRAGETAEVQVPLRPAPRGGSAPR